ncbi:hypothetical protein [Ferrimonas sp. YFM]|uniref:hypothetical protein n=1 Tax=Ferrimonas sp. YFM TaxID=3028878 RepID=UPI002572F8D8|nr:hypothetical protein [Ferrimonas sp. YFM]BDY04772.1 hypothetical protein F0521_18130 [Ferrimonas sp. YFM]
MIVRPRQSKQYRGEIRSSHSASEVFPLMCPVREREWVPGWDPLMVWSNSGRVESDCVFTTQEPAGPATWYVLESDPEKGQLELLKTLPEQLLTRIRIGVCPAPQGCVIQLNYLYTAIGPRGDKQLERLDDGFWEEFVQRWDKALTRYFENQKRTA